MVAQAGLCSLTDLEAALGRLGVALPRFLTADRSAPSEHAHTRSSIADEATENYKQFLRKQSFLKRWNVHRRFQSRFGRGIGDRLMVSLRVDAALAAYKIGFRGGDTVFEWVTSFNTALKKWSPGSLLMYLLLRGAENYKFGYYDLMRGAEDNKFNRTKRIRRNFTVTLSRRS
jgi:hypothetical protein